METQDKLFPEKNPIHIKADKFRALTRKMATTYERKNGDYGDSFGASIRKRGPLAALIQIEHKFNRLDHIITHGLTECNESVLDTFLDLSVYCAIAYMELKEMNEEKE